MPPHRLRPSGDEKEGQLFHKFPSELQSDDPIMVALAKGAKSANLSPAAFKDMAQVVLEEIHGALPEPVNKEQQKALLGDGADKMISTNREWIDGLKKNGTLNEDEHKKLTQLGNDALGVQLVEKIRINSGEKPIPRSLGGSVNKGAKTPDECAAMLADERYHASGPAGDAFRLEVDKEFKLTHGTAKT